VKTYADVGWLSHYIPSCMLNVKHLLKAMGPVLENCKAAFIRTDIDVVGERAGGRIANFLLNSMKFGPNILYVSKLSVMHSYILIVSTLSAVPNWRQSGILACLCSAPMHSTVLMGGSVFPQC
jgi:hypothetical protein